MFLVFLIKYGGLKYTGVCVSSRDGVHVCVCVSRRDDRCVCVSVCLRETEGGISPSLL